MANKIESEHLLSALGSDAWSTTREVASALKLSHSPARKHLIELVVRGSVERRDDPWDSHGYIWRKLERPIGKAAPTEQLLCSACTTEQYRDIVRYREALTEEAFERWIEAGDHIGEDEFQIPPCAKCGQPIV